MKQLHRSDLFAWSAFDQQRNIDFHSILWQRPEGNVLIDPLPLSDHDTEHLRSLGGAKIIVITNSDHCRGAAAIAQDTGAEVFGPSEEKDSFPMACDHWLDSGDVVVPGLVVFALKGSKTPGELALVLDNQTLITGDLIRCHAGGQLCLLPDAKLTDRAQVIASVRQLANLPAIETVLVGDGWPVFNNGGAALRILAESLKS